MHHRFSYEITQPGRFSYMNHSVIFYFHSSGYSYMIRQLISNIFISSEHQNLASEYYFIMNLA